MGTSRRHDERAGLSGMTDYQQCDFNNTPLANGTFDGAYAIEATCHAADRVRCFSEIFRVLKPGAAFVGYEWVITDKYDDSNEGHRHIRHLIELGNALATLTSAAVVVDALTAAGFVVEMHYDVIQRATSSP